MKIILVTGSGGLVGSESARFYLEQGSTVIGVDNDMRARFFGPDASTSWNVARLQSDFSNYRHHDLDIRNLEGLDALFRDYSSDIDLIIHTAAQPSHDWAAKDPQADFGVNANGTLNLLEMTRQHSPRAAFIFTSTNKVYGDRPNSLPLIEQETRWEVDRAHPYAEHGIDESMSIDASKHSLFGASKVAADVLVQEYGRYFDMNTVAMRGGCLTGPSHSGTVLHGFLAYLMKCVATGSSYKIFGYKGKQVRDNIHSSDLVAAFDCYYRNPRQGEVYNIGGGRFSNCSMLEAIDMCEQITGRKLDWEYVPDNRSGDHIWWISDIRKFQQHYPEWWLKYDLTAILKDIYDHSAGRWHV